MDDRILLEHAETLSPDTVVARIAKTTEDRRIAEETAKKKAEQKFREIFKEEFVKAIADIGTQKKFHFHINAAFTNDIPFNEVTALINAMIGHLNALSEKNYYKYDTRNYSKDNYTYTYYFDIKEK